ncbi:uncharacterized protein BCR38DRAFT_411470 [Pseudomassariella vexata]|uniref:Uncharacterized protein n=1 Tax=Pseudomassariella vexata TaxID=1141098 RepID=A0A1Y2DQR9_9PEZI|nr:uncharacterized protein BCR38DRAFT_411470 [Pseudomassariella vexata]ORY61610.1 hypothetical protein BCR38DRAFT_411470 [Pseudomassariella vexata]
MKADRHRHLRESPLDLKTAMMVDPLPRSYLRARTQLSPRTNASTVKNWNISSPRMYLKTSQHPRLKSSGSPRATLGERTTRGLHLGLRRRSCCSPSMDSSNLQRPPGGVVTILRVSGNWNKNRLGRSSVVMTSKQINFSKNLSIRFISQEIWQARAGHLTTYLANAAVSERFHPESTSRRERGRILSEHFKAIGSSRARNPGFPLPSFCRWHADQVQLDMQTSGESLKTATITVTARILDANESLRDQRRRSVNTHLARGRKWSRLVDELSFGILFRHTWALAKADNSSLQQLVSSLQNSTVKMSILRHLEAQLETFLSMGRTNPYILEQVFTREKLLDRSSQPK